MSLGTNLGSQKGRWIILAALVAVLGALMFLLPGVQAQQTAETYYHQENDDNPVVTLSATDPEGVARIHWDIFTDDGNDQDLPGGIVAEDADDVLPADTADGGLFEVEGGVLSFMAAPDFEMSISNATANTYKVVVQASDGGGGEAPEWVQYFKITVIVLDVEEEGSVSWMIDPDGDGADTAESDQILLEFQAGAVVTAEVTDPDGPDTIDTATTTTWNWYRSSSNAGPWTLIDLGDDPTDQSYEVSDAANDNDVGMYLRSVASYTDDRGSNKSAENISDYPVRPAKVQNNTPPKFDPTSVAREVQESSAGRNVGPPIVATDDDGDVLNYTMVTTGNPPFGIDPATGQITTNMVLDYDTLVDSATPVAVDETPVLGVWSNKTNLDLTTSLVYPLVVRATDSAGANTGEADTPDDLTVTITLLNVNEAPEFDIAVVATIDGATVTATNTQGIVQKNEEGVGAAWDAVVAYYGVDDPEGVDVNAGKWSLSGADADEFQLTGTTANFRTLEFKEKADFENPGDSNGDNIYEVTVVASDGTNQAERSVTVKITDSDEAGMIALSDENPVTGSVVTAILTDSDGDVINVGWRWYALTATQVTDGVPDAVALEGPGIAGATSDSYTPTSDDIGRHLVAVAVYMDRTEDEDNGTATEIGFGGVRFDNRAQSNPSAAVIDDPANAAPMFMEGAPAVRYVEENEAPGDLVARDPSERIGAPLVISDGDLPNDSHTFTLSGSDAAHFDIVSSTAGGQLMTKEPLNYENKKTYNVVVTVKDGSGESNDTDTINVMIQVKDLDEHPVITGDENVQHYENDTGTVLTLVANDPERVTPIHWSIYTTIGQDEDLPGGNEGPNADDITDEELADGGLFEAPNGVLTFAVAPDFETNSASGDDFYQVVVQASDGGLTAWVQYFKITVEVLDKEEGGEVNWTVTGDGTTLQTPDELLEFQPDALLTASVTDPDGPATLTDITWQWYRSTSRTGGWVMIDEDSGDNPATDHPDEDYTVSDETGSNDVGNYLRVVARYTDARGANEVAEKISEYKVIPRKVNANSVPEFAPTEHNRRIQENAATGTAVGGVVTATDADGDVLNYTLHTETELFDIDQKSGQIMVAASLDYETIRGDSGANTLTPGQTHNAGSWALINNDDGTTSLNYVVDVRATDSAGDETVDRAPTLPNNAHAQVTITLLNVNEAPDFTNGDRIEGMAPDRHEETTAPPATDFADGVDAWNAVVSTYTAVDPEGVVLDGSKWSLSGDDAAQFKLTGTTDGTRTLEFVEAVDFENPGDRNGDNIYEVTVVVSDGSEPSEVDVTVKVLDSDEPGVITFAPDANPVAGKAITANLSDSDGEVIKVAWQWYTKDESGGTATLITGETSDTYTPDGGDIGKILEVTARYMDRTEDEDNAETDDSLDTIGLAGVRFANMVTSSETAPVIDDPANARPVFVEGATPTRYVEEDNLPGETAGRDPVERISRELAVTDEDPNATHAFTLSGTDADYFDIEVVAGGGQLMTKARLDYETKDTYTVVVTANDGSGEANATASITVTIEVKDLDEKPEIFESGLVVSGSSSVAYMENGTDAVATYTAVGSMADMASLTLMVGDDARYFTLTNGVLTFKRSPDYEMPRNAPMSDTNTNTYMVTVKATDGTYTNIREVTVTVTNVDELGRLSGPTSPSYVENSTEAVGTYMANGMKADEANWSLMGDDMGDLSISSSGVLTFDATPNFEMPMDEGMDNTYMVTVKAEAGGEMKMMPVTVMVTNVEELGMLSGPDSVNDYRENGEGAVGTYMVASIPGAANPNWTLMGDDMGDLSISTSGVLTFDAPPNYEMPMDEGMDNTYEVTVKAEAGGEMKMVDVTVTVTNEDEDGMVTLMPMRPSIGTEITATLTDPDMPVTGTTWQWSRSMEMEEGYTDITGTTSAMYTPMADDDGYYLKATAMYTDGLGSGKVADEMTGTPVSLYAIDGPTSRSYMENGTDAVATYIASGDAATTWTLDGDDAGDFTITTGGVLRFMSSPPNYEMPMDADTNNVYMVTVNGSDGTNMDTEAVTVTVTNEDEAGTVTLTPMAPSVDTEITAELSDDDGGITGTTWQWAKHEEPADGSMPAADSAAWMDITGEISASYAPVEGDAGMYLRATATYDDAEGSGKTATSETVMISADVVGRYDTNDDETVDALELSVAISDYLSGELDPVELSEVIAAYING